MNFQTILEELDRLYEENLKDTTNAVKDADAKPEQETLEEGKTEKRVKGKDLKKGMKTLSGKIKTIDNLNYEGTDYIEVTYTDGGAEDFEPDEDVIILESLTEEVEAEDAEEAEVDTADVEATDEPSQLVLECSKCGGISIKAEAEVELDEETGLANAGEECQYCEEAEGYKVIGTLMPYAQEEPVDNAADDEIIEESMLTEGKFIDNIKKVATRVGADAATLVRVFTELGELATNIGNKGEYKTTKLNDFMEYVENKAVLKALMNGNEKVMNSLTKDDIEDLQDDIERYQKRKAGEDTDLEEGIFDVFKKKPKTAKVQARFVTNEDEIVIDGEPCRVYEVTRVNNGHSYSDEYADVEITYYKKGGGKETKTFGWLDDVDIVSDDAYVGSKRSTAHDKARNAEMRDNSAYIITKNGHIYYKSIFDHKRAFEKVNYEQRTFGTDLHVMTLADAKEKFPLEDFTQYNGYDKVCGAWDRK